MFLPVKRSELADPEHIDFVLISADAYVDHPTFGHALIARLVESLGFSVGIIPQPVSDDDYRVFPTPRYGFLVSGGVVDSMVNNYTASLKKRSDDAYSPGNRAGRRPDRAVTVYTRNLKRLFPGVPVVIGGIEASLRRFAHYDYWSDSVMPSVLVDSGADLLIYGMGEKPIFDIASRLKQGIPLAEIKDVRGTCYLADESRLPELFAEGASALPSWEEVRSDKKQYARAFRRQSRSTDPVSGEILIQKQGKNRYLVANRPQFPLTTAEMDAVYDLPFEREAHPMYEGGIKALEEVKFSVTSHRGCFGSCSFCALNYHQGRRIQKRSIDSIVKEVEGFVRDPAFKGNVHDVGGATANFRNPSCDLQERHGVCKDRYCIGSKPCPNLKVDHTEYIDLLRRVRAIPGVKRVFVRSGVRFDYVMYDKDETFLKELIAHHISGQLKVAPEHASDKVLKVMNKAPFAVYEAFYKRYFELNKEMGKEQYLVPYMIASHPGCGLKEAAELTEYLKKIRYMPEQVQDFYPTPSTRSTCIYYTGIDPDTMEEEYVPRTREEKRMQRALLQYRKPENAELLRKAYGILAEEGNKQGGHKKGTQGKKSYGRKSNGKGQKR